jgi:hypothetical protein
MDSKAIIGGPGTAFSYIRWSHPAQTEGDSLRRQLDDTLEYCKENKLKLNDSLKLVDPGRSGFFKANIHKGRLGEFLKMVKDGRIAKGSVLIIENLDRLTRAQVGDALEILRSILRYGVDVVTLTDKHRYTKASLNDPMELMLSIMTFYRSHDESVQKANRVRKAWAKKREELNQSKLTARAPYWLEYNPKTGEFNERKEAVRLIKRIFKMSFNGMGHGSIAKTLNLEGERNFAKHTDWQPSYVAKILSNGAVIGEYQPFTWRSQENEETGEIRRWREPIGEAVKGYYPTIIEPEYFYAVQQRKRDRRSAVGRLYPDGKSKQPAILSNLFTGIAKCGFCGAPMVFVNKGSDSIALVCDKSRRGLGCRYVGYPYKEFEAAFLKYCSELNLNEIFRDDAAESVLSEVEAKEGEIGKLKNHIERLVTAMRTAKKEPTAIVNEVGRLEDELKLRQQELQHLREKEAEARSEGNRLTSLQAVIAELDSAPATKLNEMRHAVRQRIAACVKRITVYPYDDDFANFVGLKLGREERRDLTKRGFSVTSEIQKVVRYLEIDFKDLPTCRQIFSHPKYGWGDPTSSFRPVDPTEVARIKAKLKAGYSVKELIAAEMRKLPSPKQRS